MSNKDELVFQAFAYHPFFFIRKTHLDEELEPQLLELQKKMGVKVPKIELQTGIRSGLWRVRRIICCFTVRTWSPTERETPMR